MLLKKCFFLTAFSSSFLFLFSEIAEISANGISCRGKIERDVAEIFVSLPYFDDEGGFFDAKSVKIECEAADAVCDLRIPASIRGKDGRVWRISAAMQLPNSDFAQWHEEKVPGFATIGSTNCKWMPCKYENKVWGASNAAFGVSGSKNWPVEAIKLPSGKMAAKLQTRKVFGTIAAGSIFSGYVPKDITLAKILNNSESSRENLIKLGTRFSLLPRAFRLRFAYDGKGDSCKILVRFENREDGIVKTVRFAGYSEASDNVADAENVIFISEKDSDGLRTLEMQLSSDAKGAKSDEFLPKNALFCDENPTHVVVSISSSADADRLEGVKGATLIVSDFEFVY